MLIKVLNFGILFFLSEKEQLNKSNEYLKIKIDEYEMRENDLLAQIKKHIDLVKHLEMEKTQVKSILVLLNPKALNSYTNITPVGKV